MSRQFALQSAEPTRSGRNQSRVNDQKHWVSMARLNKKRINQTNSQTNYLPQSSESKTRGPFRSQVIDGAKDKKAGNRRRLVIGWIPVTLWQERASRRQVFFRHCRTSSRHRRSSQLFVCWRVICNNDAKVLDALKKAARKNKAQQNKHQQTTKASRKLGWHAKEVKHTCYASTLNRCRSIRSQAAASISSTFCKWAKAP